LTTLSDYYRHHLLTPLHARHADNGRLVHRRVLLQHRLDLPRRDVLAAADDQVLRPAGDVDVAVVVHPADVAGVEPAAAHRLVSLVVQPQVAGHDAGALGHDLALLSRGQQLPLRVDYRHGHVLHGPADGAQALQPLLALLRRPLRDPVVPRAAG